MPGAGSALSASYISGETLYVYHPKTENANFGSLKMHSFDGNANIVKKESVIN